MRHYVSSSSRISQALPSNVLGEGHSFERQSNSRMPAADSPTYSAWAALVFGALACYSSSRQSELTSELLCWILLPVVFHIATRWRNGAQHAKPLPSVNGLPEVRGDTKPPALSLWLVSIGIAICSVFRAEVGVAVLFPALPPLLAIGYRYLRPGIYPPPVPHTSPFSLLTRNVMGITLTATFAIIILSEWDPLAYALSLVPIITLFVVYTLLTPQIGNRSKWARGFDIEAAVLPLSLRVVVLLAIILGRESYVIGFPNANVIDTLSLGLIKALTWYFTSQLARNSSWVVATIAGTFTVLATQNPFAQQTDIRAFMTVIASLVPLGQTISLLPKQATAKSTLWIIASLPVLAFLANLGAIQISRSSALIHFENHPIEALTREAKTNFDSLLRAQSKTYPAAYAEYQRRYGFDPPHGFEEWYKFAQSHQSPIIDEFDIISEGITPFLRLSGKEILQVMSQVYDEPDHELWSCSMSGQPAKTQCSHHGRENDRNNAHFFDRITNQIPSSLDLKFLLNHLDEPTVIIPPPSQQASKPNITNLGGKRSWEALTDYCYFRNSKATTEKKTPVETYGFPFVTDRKSSMDLCQHAEYRDMHGLLVAPESLRLVQGLVPVLSTGAPSTMGDLLYPSSAYVEEDRFRYHEEHDVQWDKKKNNLYWAGSTTGGHARVAQWQNLHRQRFVELAQHLTYRPLYYLQERNGVIARVRSLFLNSRLYDVAFAKVLQCDTKACKEQRQYFKRKPWESGDRPFLSRLVFDLDGNGISGRYYKLLASKSAPLKQSLIREWHDDRLMPWVHYIPVSQSMEELPELVFYLTSTESGQQRARDIAEQGRQWFSHAFRDVDIVIYVYRLLLELARLQDPERPAWNIDVEE
ncbi:hypothetical protein F4859DRAFT_500196 [Xylaria cf. heliscus]|nr:hypothetical protein F4859DRAFT_500196 [Xylaria cf. heliscus]